MINRKSREESEGAGSGLEIKENKPYTNGPNNTSGQYTEKTYYVAKHVPSWLLRFFSDDAKKNLAVEEISHNAYPFTKTIQSTPMISGFSLEIETHFKPDLGRDDSIFNKKYPIELLNFVDRLGTGKGGDNVFETDPLLFRSRKNPNKGPLEADWLEKARDDWDFLGRRQPDWRDPNDYINEPNMNKAIGYSCAYKVVKVNFKVFGIGSRVESFIHNSIIKPMLCQAHRQVWCWQDEWCDLTLEEIRKQEKCTMKKLFELFHGVPVDGLYPSYIQSSSEGEGEDIEEKEIEEQIEKEAPKRNQILDRLSIHYHTHNQSLSPITSIIKNITDKSKDNQNSEIESNERYFDIDININNIQSLDETTSSISSYSDNNNDNFKDNYSSKSNQTNNKSNNYNFLEPEQKSVSHRSSIINEDDYFSAAESFDHQFSEEEDEQEVEEEDSNSFHKTLTNLELYHDDDDDDNNDDNDNDEPKILNNNEKSSHEEIFDQAPEEQPEIKFINDATTFPAQSSNVNQKSKTNNYLCICIMSQISNPDDLTSSQIYDNFSSQALHYINRYNNTKNFNNINNFNESSVPGYEDQKIVLKLLDLDLAAASLRENENNSSNSIW